MQMENIKWEIHLTADGKRRFGSAAGRSHLVGANNVNLIYLYTLNPQVTVTVAKPNPATVVWGNNVQTDTITNEAVTTCTADPKLGDTDEHGGLAHGPPAQALATGSDLAKTNDKQASGDGMLRGPQIFANDPWAESVQNWTVKW